ncbi:uncharacterized protein EDB91DRAFT_1234996 [Suillus paluster]|uniref:uncharacterized protein n=1 Tax=Suillus paluster TaxID=48578 RepID=UPI001B867692|nr:uncharacterized protein EDB91DRAFT_1234996 [Suillus paluster]KAG1750432.1 hypothetical protein EDB91DRAFT_1234996 [Suillus paluster]
MKDWVSPMYMFFHPEPRIVVIGRQHAYKFKCYAQSTGNMRKHVKVCWGDDVLAAADDAKDANEARTKIVGGILHNGSITVSFERKGKGKVTYSHHQNMKAKTQGPEYYIPSPSTEYPGKLNFTTDGWTAMNHQAFVAVSAHLEHNGKPLSLPLDIIKVAKV